MMLLVVVGLRLRVIGYGVNGDPSELVTTFAVQEELEEFERQQFGVADAFPVFRAEVLPTLLEWACRERLEEGNQGLRSGHAAVTGTMR